MAKDVVSDRNLALESVRVTESAALAAYNFMGGGDEKAVDQAAVSAMHRTLNRLALDGTVRIGEGAEGEAEKLYVGETLGTGDGPKVDIALVALEGTTIVARGGPNALAVIAMAEDGGFLTVPNIYMDKIAVGPGLPDGIVDLDNEPADNLAALADAKGTKVTDLVVCMLDRPRHAELIAKIRETGARIRLIQDGDVSGVIAATQPEAGVDIFLGIGGAPQGVLAAAALRGVGGQMQGRLVFRNNDQRTEAQRLGIEDLERKYATEDMASGNVTFAATGVTYSDMLEGVRHVPGGAITHSMVLRSTTGTLRFIEGHHDFIRGTAKT
ncbi:MAG TPA: class II fructose-bisphosphatase [Rhodospirillales bacterium]|jgi:fructose-1,6-bisphosphatase II / sedoheptulose-1,7-bisphosphatase|nr:MAG: Fructose-1,6-bisphosphatase class 2 [Alphaproteobacteria bacterium MarineAlpha3_Bin3]HIM42938.1 class II fructose-bisphosphatase [Rhodospirillales bacterium]HIN20285.1 class II fructose-bisphosphatase [Rhodospirillales bacterium]